MCGRVNVIDNPGLVQLLRDLGIDLALPPAVNVAPTERLSVVRELDQQRSMDSARWWLTPAWASEVSQKYAMFNARSETLATSRAFRKPFESQRAIVPVSSFIEWRKEGDAKQPYLISSASGAFAMAALWEEWRGGDEPLLTCTLVTTAAAPAFEPWHHRMPVVLAPQEVDLWLDNTQTVEPQHEIFSARLKEPWSVCPLSRNVSNARNKGPQDMEPIGESVVLAA
ncbi:MAG: SOS response-associated peptidase [Halioglobus sp.]